MGDSTRDADADVIVSGREPRRRARRPGGLVWLLVVAQAAALAVAAAVAVHYRAEAGRHGGHYRRRPARCRPGAVHGVRRHYRRHAGNGLRPDRERLLDRDPRPDEVWATGLARADGTADLTGYTWTGAVAHRYWMALDPSPVDPAPGLHGHFAAGTAAPSRDGQAPCTVSP